MFHLENMKMHWYIIYLILITKKSYINHTSLNLVTNAQVCVYLTVHITKLQLQITFPKPFYISHSACIHRDLGH